MPRFIPLTLVALGILSPPVSPPQAQTLVRALTRDTSGNGYLDRIEAHFDRAVAFPGTYQVENVRVSFDAFIFQVSAIRPASGEAPDTVFYFDIEELPNDTPQTAWTPTVAVGGHPEIAAQQIVCEDGAGPVIWHVSREIHRLDYPRKSNVTVKFSERLRRAPDPSEAPEDFFQVWYREDSSQFIEMDSAFIAFGSFAEPAADEVLSFRMTNCWSLQGWAFLSIRVGGERRSPVQDNSPLRNAPEANNRKERVTIDGMDVSFDVGPNPFHQIRGFYDDGPLKAVDRRGVRQAYAYGGLTVVAELVVVSDTNMTVAGELCVYDMTKNPVHHRKSEENLVPDWWRERGNPGSVCPLQFYWNGVADEGRESPGGTYLLELSLTVSYRHSLEGNKKHRYVHREKITCLPGCRTDTTQYCDRDELDLHSRCGSCGTGVGLAFLPPIGLRLCRVVRRRKRRKSPG